jgi:hypothetical protein
MLKNKSINNVQLIATTFMTHLKTAQKLKKNWNTDDFIIYDSLRDVIEIGANVDLAESMEIRDEDYEKDYLMTVNLNDDGTISYEILLNSYTNVREKIIEDALGEEATTTILQLMKKLKH